MREASTRKNTAVRGLMPASSAQRKDKKRKVPEPLRRAIAECTQPNSSMSGLACSPFRTLEDYMGDTSTVDMAYGCLLEHARAEQARSPPVIMKSVALLKRYLFRYYPTVATLQQIDSFCTDLIAEQKMAAAGSWTLAHREGFSSVLGAGPSAEAASALIKSLDYVRAVVARSLPVDVARSLARPNQNLQRQDGALRGLSPRASTADMGVAQAANLAMARLIQLPDSPENYVLADVLKARWLTAARGSAPTVVVLEGASIPHPHAEVKRSLAHSSGAALLLGIPAHPEEQALHCESITGLADPALARTHMRSIAATKRTENEHSHRRDGEVVLNSVRRRVLRPLFQYRYYSEQQPLRLSEAEMEVVVAAVCSETPGQPANGTLPTPSAHRGAGGGVGSVLHPDPADVAASVLIKLLIDMYLADAVSAAPLAFSLLQSMLDSPLTSVRVRAFDLVLNIGVHAHLLEPLPTDDAVVRPFANNAGGGVLLESSHPQPSSEKAPAHALFESWLVGVLCEMLLFLVQAEETEEEVWASALSCLLYLTCDHGRVLRTRLAQLDVRAIVAIIAVGAQHGWAEELQTFLIRVLVGMLYSGHAGTMRGPAACSRAPLNLRHLDKIGGIRYICAEFATAQSAEARRNLFAVMLDYVLEELQSFARKIGQRFPSDDDVAAVASALALAEVQEALVAAFKLCLLPGEPIASNLTAAITASFGRNSGVERLNNELLAEVSQGLDTLAQEHKRIPEEFKAMVGTTLATEMPEASIVSSGPPQVARAWSTLHSLLHSGRAWDRRIGHTWLLQLLSVQLPRKAAESGAKGGRGSSIQQQMSVHGKRTGTEKERANGGGVKGGGGGSKVDVSVSGAVQLMCGLVLAKSSAIRRGFLAVSEGLLVLHAHTRGSSDLEAEKQAEAEGLITLMSTSLWQLIAANDPSRINILQMCTIIFWQLCGTCSLPTAEVVEMASPLASPTAAKLGQVAKSARDASDDLSAAYVVEDYTSIPRLFLLGRSVAARPLLAALPTSLLLWPLMQLAPSAGDACQMVTAVGSHGAWGAGGSCDVRAAMLLLLIGKCNDNPEALAEVGGVHFFRSLLDDADARIAYFSSSFLLKRLMTDQPAEYQRGLHQLVFSAQQSNNEKLLENPYLQIRGLLQTISQTLGPTPSA